MLLHLLKQKTRDMKANELRIGSILSNAGGKIIKCTAQTISDFESGLIILNPVEINKTILQKSGFEQNGDWYTINDYPILINVLIGVKVTIGESECIHLSDVLYIHQLQNIFFSLYNRELNIDL